MERPRPLMVLVGFILCMSGGDECKAAKGPLDCFECSTLRGDYFCGDPFNESHANIRTIPCDPKDGHLCAKWVKKATDDAVDIDVIRTCSSELPISLYITAVCMYESRPGSGHLCFCDSDNCNSAPRAAHAGRVTTLVAIVSACLLQHALFDHFRWRQSLTLVILICCLYGGSAWTGQSGS